MSPTLDIHQLQREGWLWSGSRSGESGVGAAAVGRGDARDRLRASAPAGPSRAPSGRVDTQDFHQPLTEPMVLASRMILVNCKSCFFPAKLALSRVSFLQKWKLDFVHFCVFNVNWKLFRKMTAPESLLHRNTPVFLAGEPHGWSSLAGYSPWDRERVGHDLATKQ